VVSEEEDDGEMGIRVVEGANSERVHGRRVLRLAREECVTACLRLLLYLLRAPATLLSNQIHVHTMPTHTNAT
jgi:hypothetical protein